MFEGWIAQCLRAYNDYNGLYDEIAYWAPADAQQTEVDFLLGDPRKAHQRLGWRHTTGFGDLVRELVEADRPQIERELHRHDRLD